MDPSEGKRESLRHAVYPDRNQGFRVRASLGIPRPWQAPRVMTPDVDASTIVIPARLRPRRLWESQEAASAAISRLRPVSIGLLEHCGSGNLGDDATVAAVLGQIRRRWPHASLIGLSLNPYDSQRRHKIQCFAIRRSVYPCEQEWTSAFRSGTIHTISLKDRIKKVLKAMSCFGFVKASFGIVKACYRVTIGALLDLMLEIKFLAQSCFLTSKLDVLVICGGGQLLDWGGPWKFPYTLFKWIVLAKLSGTKCIFLNNGAGPLDRRLSRWLVNRSLSLADYVSFRDVNSSVFIRGLGFKGASRVVADCAWSLDLPARQPRVQQLPNESGLTIGIAPMAYCDPSRHWVHDEAKYQRLIRNMAEFGVCLLRRGHRLRIFSSDIWFDSKAMSDLESAIRGECPVDRTALIACESVNDIDDLLAQLSQVDCYVTCRFHGVVLAHLLNVPAVAIAPHPKVSALMEDWGLSEYCVDIAACDAGRLTAAFERLVTNIDDVRHRIENKVAANKRELDRQFDELFPEHPAINQTAATQPLGA
jgi:polysaccharide pyruvyl transferase WcaK-like protein